MLDQASEAEATQVQVALTSDPWTVDDVQLNQRNTVEGKASDACIRDGVAATEREFVKTRAVLTQQPQTCREGGQEGGGSMRAESTFVRNVTLADVEGPQLAAYQRRDGMHACAVKGSRWEDESEERDAGGRRLFLACT